ncbi:phosphate ABC transporter membrane protein 2 (PhoT family) [Volucribacter psittacicida]|uniref:Phosphate transport system permease protein PstA n=1 Tax=Volucribacter psittacicida TaxID=203482 RepID=A0A4R1G5J4_9PAST|nr:phosphate ABC transporter permease PstA [Volucribacter psittacicida]TCK01760.1 phosphate ABC transporter membrane protein 2 (PhoT family) [Volucribacter psittacicida]
MFQVHHRLFYCRKIKNILMYALCYGSVIFGLFWLCWIIATLLFKGLPSFSLQTFMLATPSPGEQGGLLNAIVGSGLLLLFALCLSVPIGVLAGTYLAEYGRYSKLASIIRFFNDILLSAPSIVIGLFIYALYVSQVKHYSGWAGSLALAVIAIPIIIRTTDNMLSIVPDPLRESAMALGCGRWRMILTICYRSAQKGILTGILLAVARLSGETAPLLFTALSNQFMSFNMNAPIANLPVVIYQYAASPFDDWNKLAWAGATCITLFVLSITLATRLLFKQNTMK